MTKVKFDCLPTMIGTMPQTDATEACKVVLHYLKDIPAWPQLPKRSFLENMYVQYSEDFPGVVVQDGKIFIDRDKDTDKALEQLYSAYLENNIYKYPITKDYAAGLHQFLTYKELSVVAVKGQIVGPVSWGMTVADNSGKAVAYDEVLGDAAAKLLRLRASWMERELRQLSKNTIIFVDEPYLTSLGSSFFALSKEKALSMIREVFSGIGGLKGIHCCGNTDWSFILGTGTDILSFDAYNFATSLSLYAQEVKKFIARGGVVAWGIVPNEEESLKKESPASLQDRLEEAIAPFTRQGIDIPFKDLKSQSLLTPSCGMPSLSPEAANTALELLNGLSERMRRK
jgi:methionine synthase II (cobalamin-independent)